MARNAGPEIEARDASGILPNVEFAPLDARSADALAEALAPVPGDVDAWIIRARNAE